MSDNPFLCIKSGLAPYPDESGHKVIVEIRQETPDEEATITFENVWRLEISEWPDIVAGIDRMMKALPRKP